MNLETFHSTDIGTPQGGNVSPILANMTSDGIEKLLHEHFPKMKVHFIRYFDDFFVIAPTKEIAYKVREIIREFLTIRGLELSVEKTLITHINEGFDFLGWNCATRSCFRDYGSIRPLSA